VEYRLPNFNTGIGANDLGVT